MQAAVGQGSLVDYTIMAFSRQPELAREGLGALLVEAFRLMAAESFPDEVPTLPRGTAATVTPEEAAALVAKYRSVRAAARMTGYSKDALRRALLKREALTSS